MLRYVGKILRNTYEGNPFSARLETVTLLNSPHAFFKDLPTAYDRTF